MKNNANPEEEVKVAADKIRSLAGDIESLCKKFGNELNWLEYDKMNATRQRDAAIDVCRALMNWDKENDSSDDSINDVIAQARVVIKEAAKDAERRAKV